VARGRSREMTKGSELNEEQLRQWVEGGFTVPEGVDPEALVPELTELLGCTDSVTRERSYEILTNWCTSGQICDEVMRSLGRQMASNVAVGLGEAESDTVLLRSYCALVLCAPIAADHLFGLGLVEGRDAFLASEQVKRWCCCAVESLRRERDPRAYVDGKGWAHATAHVGDALCQLTRCLHLDVTDLERMLGAIYQRLAQPSEGVFVHDEGARLMRVVYHMMLRGDLPLERLTSWIETFSKAPDGREWGWGGIFELEFCDRRMVNAQANVREALRSLYFMLTLGLRRRHDPKEADNPLHAFLH